MSKPSTSGQLKSSAPWIVLLVVVLTGMAGPVNYYKVPPLMPFLIHEFHLSGGVAGLLMSTFAVVGILLSIPAGFILHKLGYRLTGLMAVGWVAAGAGLGALSTGSGALLSTRLMEGVGLNLLAVVSPTIVALHFESKNRAFAIGIWNAWYPLGSTVTFLIAPFLASLWGWRSVWWFGCLYALAVGSVYFFSIKPHLAGKPEGHKGASNAESGNPGAKSAFFNREVWIMSIMFFCFSFMYIGYLTWTPTFLHRTRGVSLAHAAFLMSFLSVTGIVSSASSGWLLARLRSPRLTCIAVIAALSALSFLTCFLSTQYVLPLVIVAGLIGGFIPSASLTVVARLIHEKKVSPIAFSVVTLGQNTGILLGPTLLGTAMESAYGWPLAYAIFIPVGALGMVAAAFLDRGCVGSIVHSGDISRSQRR
jgi:MFS family permease